MSNNNQSREDEQIALDMQMAFDIQERDVQIQQRLDLMNQREQQRHQQLATTARQQVITNSSRRRVQQGQSNLIETKDGLCSGITSDHMLYVACEVEGQLVEMLVDSGAASSAISKNEMIRLKLENKLNTRFAGKAVGCGSATVLGVVENVTISFGQVEFRLFFLVLDTDNPLMILGLDQMRKYKCIINIEENKLIFGGTGGVEVQFIPYETSSSKSVSTYRQGDCIIS